MPGPWPARHAEIHLGLEGWLGFDDPFPAWWIVDDGDDDLVAEEDESA